MSKKEEKQASGNGAENGAAESGANGGGSGSGGGGGSDPKNWVKVQTDRPVYSADRGKGQAVQGLLLGCLWGLKSNQPGQDTWDALIVRLTAPVQCKIRKEGGHKEIVAPPGTEILVPMNHKLQHLIPIANDLKALWEVAIIPNGTIKTPNGNANDYDMRVNPQPRTRAAADRLLVSRKPAELPGSGGSGGGEFDSYPEGLA